MRIRKRQVPLPLSSLLPIPLSDPLLTRINPLVQLYLDNDDSSYPHQPIGGSTTAQDSSPDAGTRHDQKVLLGKEERWRGGEEEGTRTEGEEEEERSSSKCYNDTRGASFFGAKLETTSLVPQQPAASSYDQRVVVEKWGTEGERTFSLKRRRGSFDKGSYSYKESSNTMVEAKDKKMSLKNKVNKKCVVQEGNSNFYDSDDQGGGFNEESKGSVAVVANGAKKKGRGGALMEGSRCSRVNGRGWRCCQQTLVGYSLCEHHLGKGRLRSMTSVRSRSVATATPTKKVESSRAMLQMPIPSLSFEEKETMHALLAVSKAASAAAVDVEDEQYCSRDIIDGHQKVKNIAPIGMVSTSTKKRLKLGVVKARSMSSLLGQPNNGMINLDCGDRK